MEIYAVGFLVGVAGVVVRGILGGDEGAGYILSVRSFEGDSDGKLDCEGPRDGDPQGV